MPRLKCFLVEFDQALECFVYAGTGQTVQAENPDGSKLALAARYRYDLPAGAMWFAETNNIAPGRSNPCLFVKCPSKTGSLCVWNIDGQAIDGGIRYGDGWKREGVPPEITAIPSIHFPGEYHGWLRAGYLEEC